MQSNMKVILFTTLLLFSINGFAFNWKKVTESDAGHFFYVDNIKKHNGLVYYWMLDDYLEPLDGGSLGNANSAIAKYKVDCVEEKQTWLNGTFYSQSMGKGRIVDEINPNNVTYPKPNTVGYTLMKFVCDYAK